MSCRSGVSVGTIYQFFKDVEAVRAAVAERTYADLRSALAAQDHDAGQWLRPHDRSLDRPPSKRRLEARFGDMTT